MNRLLGLAMLVVVSACSSGATGAEAATSGEPGDASSSTVIEDYPDAIVRDLWRQMRAPRPVPNSALPPRHLDVERFPELLVERSLIVSGGPPPDGIQSIDEPIWRPAADIDWLAADESVLAVELDGAVHLYPTQIMLWHEIVNDVIGDTPVTVTYCPLCNSAVAYDRRVGGEVLEFGTSGALYHSALVMYDRQTESLWTHFDGRAVVGDLIGAELDLIAVQTMSWSAAVERWPNGLVLDRPTGDLGRRPYGTSPYPSYEGLDEPLPGFYQGDPDPRLQPRARVVGLVVGDRAVAVDRRAVEDAGALDITVDGTTIHLEHRDGVRSPLDGRAVAEGVDIGSITAGDQSGPVPVLDTFWFAWSAYFPDTDLVTDAPTQANTMREIHSATSAGFS